LFGVAEFPGQVRQADVGVAQIAVGGIPANAAVSAVEWQ
jgi:hypothetical protein